MNNFKESVLEIIENYKANFDKLDKEERYKWEAVKHFQSHFNIDADDLSEMFKISFGKAYNLLSSVNYFPYKMIIEMSKWYREEIRNLFKMLFDEEIPLDERCVEFSNKCDQLVKDRNIASYQDPHAVSVYLAFRYPEKYYIYKNSVRVKFVDKTGYNEEKLCNSVKYNRYLNYIKMLNKVREIIVADKQLIEMSRARLDGNCFKDDNLTMLTMDVVYSIMKDNNVNTYWPTKNEYDPGISVDDYLKILKDKDVTTDDAYNMMFCMYKLGGESTCGNLADKYGGSPAHYNMTANNFAKRISEKYNIKKCYDGQSDELRVFPILFIGRKVKETGGSFYSWKMRNELYKAVEIIDNEKVEEGENMKTDVNLNTILYGPPGTGKTYNTVTYAVSIIENKTIEQVKNEDRMAVLNRYKNYKEQGLIEFTTFHQSYGYEEFIEGIKPVMDQDENDNNNDIKYDVVPGVFKKFCETASNPVFKNVDVKKEFNKDPVIWKVSLGGTYDNPVRKDCMDNNHIRIAWDQYGENITDETIFTDGGKAILNSFIYKMRTGDIILSCYSAKTIDAIGVVEDEYEWHNEYKDYKRLRKVKWLVKGINHDITEINNSRTMTLSTVYKMNISMPDLMDILKIYMKNTEIEDKKRNYVFIIDEINRGNISKIFGELITLIEESKRVGKEEATRAKLPYSGKLFGVPENVYILGTMNTADRSIAMIDTALRRRFNFVEMQPDASVLNGIVVDGLSISNMLLNINKKISILYDREHTIGHAYFLPLKNQPTIPKLAEIFKNNIIPLMQEYFYEDYSKIRMVLGDNRVNENEDIQFIKEIKTDLNKLFGSNDLDENFSYEINEKAFYNIESYKKI